MFDYKRIHSAITALRSKQIFFVGGAMKSGTTWLQILLDAHPNISCNGEGHLPNHLAPLMRRALDEHSEYTVWKNKTIFTEFRGYPHFSEEHYLYLLASAIALLLIEQTKNKAARVIGEKTPDNIRFLPLLDAAFPRARFIQVVRDGRDCAVSCWFHNLRVSPGWAQKQFGSMDGFVKMFADEWIANVGAGRKFGEQQPARYLEVRYEDLSSNPEGTLEKAFRFLGVGFSQDVVKRCCVAGSFEKLSGGRSPGEENRESFLRKGLPGEWHNHLDDEMNRIFQEKAGEWLSRFGYT